MFFLSFSSPPLPLSQLHGCVQAGTRAARLHQVSVWRHYTTCLLQQRPLRGPIICSTDEPEYIFGYVMCLHVLIISHNNVLLCLRHLQISAYRWGVDQSCHFLNVVLFLWVLFPCVEQIKGALCTPVEKPNDLISGTD